MKISIITDEISSDPETAIELGSQWGIHDFELRGYFHDRIPLISNFQKHCLRETLEEFQSRIIAIGPGIFKVPGPTSTPQRHYLGWMDKVEYENWMGNQANIDHHLNELLPASLDFANELGAKLVIIFSFDRAGSPPGPPPDEVLNYLRRATERANAAGLELTLENEAGFWADSGKRTAELVNSVNHPSLRINWDPGNAFFAGDRPFPEGYQFVRGLIKHVHFKDAAVGENGQFTYTASGEVDWKGQVFALEADGYDGYISVETHNHPKVASACAAVERLKSLIAMTRNPLQVN